MGSLHGTESLKEAKAMTFKELKTIISSGEGERLEVKETTGQKVDACEALCALLNKDGVLLLLA